MATEAPFFDGLDFVALDHDPFRAPTGAALSNR